jgi:hypothetical protein
MTGKQTVRQVSDFGTRVDLREIDEDINKRCTPESLTRAVLRGRYLESSLAKSFEKGRPLGIRNQREIVGGIAKAVYDIPTCRGYIISGQIGHQGARRYVLSTASTVLPWADGEKEVGPMYLCMNVAYSRKEPLAARLGIVQLSVEDEHRTVLVTNHVCDQIEKRAGIKGSHVAFVADSIVFNDLRICKQINETRLLTIFDRDHKAIGYCPIGKKRCGLQRIQDAVTLPLARKFVSVQDRWRLKTFLPIEYFVEAEDGCLVPRRSKFGKELLFGQQDVIV